RFLVAGGGRHASGTFNAIPGGLEAIVLNTPAHLVQPVRDGFHSSRDTRRRPGQIRSRRDVRPTSHVATLKGGPKRRHGDLQPDVTGIPHFVRTTDLGARRDDTALDLRPEHPETPDVPVLTRLVLDLPFPELEIQTIAGSGFQRLFGPKRQFSLSRQSV